MYKNSRGLSMLEMVIACFILFMIVFAMYEILLKGMLMWKISSIQQSNEQKAIVVANKLFYDLKITAASSITTFNYLEGSPVSNLNYYTSGEIADDANSNNGISFRSPMVPDTGEIDLDDWMGKLRWQSYSIYYLKKDPKQDERYILCQRSISLGDRAGEVNSCPLEQFKPGATIDYYITGSTGGDIGAERVISLDVVRMRFSHYPFEQVEFYVMIGNSFVSKEDTASNRTSKLKVVIAN